ncbi:hypothetical protein K437DRAFT_242961 [Tilletiaria anomala UBC 951]|uniref:tRNA-splicing endonuclease subunit Sen54 N-terminal domain-containing protein n=1 Tax=Tilletiaria anomala (strain ATCC 24038 / CBS 436.72 / UBC 951) TaxID=1037660 RepID=A0A066WPD8_TILAU|nr:uncharacterized protein K437DRAFT_242961 [Tilletiaria anomala UBC 951]KDN52834.1 hypothetical protein K437DRAFT_242961 [Tilletiaria anomala UBC 951]
MSEAVFDVDSELDPSQLVHGQDVGSGQSLPTDASRNGEDTKEQDESDDGEDEMPDYSSLATLLAKSKGPGSSSLDAFIPKRGEKDFEPTGFTGQTRALQQSRQTMYQAISGQRVISARNLSTAVWDPLTKRATMGVIKGSNFASMGVTIRREVPHLPYETVKLDPTGVPYPKYESSVQLSPEETLYLMERGALECSLRQQMDSHSREAHVPLSLQHAFAIMLGPKSCTREEYQVYAYLRRLGYVVQRVGIIDDLRRSAAARSGPVVQVSDEHAPSLWGTWGRTLPTSILIAISACLDIIRKAMPKLARSLAKQLGTLNCIRKHSASSKISEAGLQLGLGRPRVYGDVFSELQFIPEYSASKPKGLQEDKNGRGKGLQPCFYAWRPATMFKRTDPPPPEFRIAVCAAKDVNLPSLVQFSDLFSSEALPDGDAQGELDRLRMLEQAQRNNSAYGKGKARLNDGQEFSGNAEPNRAHGTASQRAFAAWSQLFAHCAPGCASNVLCAAEKKPRPPNVNPYPALKAGKRNIVLAVVDEGCTALLRFGESDFNAWKLAG